MTRDEIALAQEAVLKSWDGAVHPDDVGTGINRWPLAAFALPLIDVLDTIARRGNVRVLLRVDAKPDEPVSMIFETQDGTDQIALGRYTLQKDGAGVWGVL